MANKKGNLVITKGNLGKKKVFSVIKLNSHTLAYCTEVGIELYDRKYKKFVKTILIKPSKYP